MFTYAYDIVEGTIVFLFSGPSNDDADYERYIATFRLLDEKLVQRDVPIAIVLIDRGNPTPNALWRKRIADAAASLRARPLLIVVSDSAIARGVVRAVSWIRPLPFQAETASQLDEAIVIAERHRGRPLPSLKTLEQEARTSAKAVRIASATSA